MDLLSWWWNFCGTTFYQFSSSTRGDNMWKVSLPCPVSSHNSQQKKQIASLRLTENLWSLSLLLSTIPLRILMSTCKDQWQQNSTRQLGLIQFQCFQFLCCTGPFASQCLCVWDLTMVCFGTFKLCQAWCSHCCWLFQHMSVSLAECYRFCRTCIGDKSFGWCGSYSTPWSTRREHGGWIFLKVWGGVQWRISGITII